MERRVDKGIRIGIEKNFVLVRDFDRDYFGGKQGWFAEDVRPKINKYGCGVVGAVNTYLYLAGITRVTKVGYMSLVEEFLKMYPLSRFCLNTGLGVLPWQMSSYIKRKCRAAGISLNADWKGRGGIDKLYEKIKESLQQGNPVIWAFFNLKPSHKIQSYKYISGEFTATYLDANSFEHKYDEVNSHYVTVTAIIERQKDDRLQRWVEISSWGSKYYVNYDEFEAFVRRPGGVLNPANLINGYCSNILIVNKL